MGLCGSNKRSYDEDERHMDVSTIHIQTQVTTQTNTKGILGNDGVIPHSESNIIPNVSLLEYVLKIQDCSKLKINTYVFEAQMELSTKYASTEYMSFAIIPNKINNIILSYW